MKFNVICGTPRSGSTLLCNILNQNPRFHASSTSCVSHSVRALSGLWSASSEVKSDLIGDKEGTEKRLVRATRAMVSAWYEDKDAEVIFDKGRLWNHQALALKQLFPESHMFVCIRDPRDIIASIEKQHGKNPMLDEARSPQELSLVNRVERKCEPNGIVGQQIDGVLDLIKRQLPFVHPIEFATLVKHPQRVMDSIYDSLGEESFEHDFEDVKNTATDTDGLYLNKFPHQGDGPVVAPKGNWSEHLPADLATKIMQRFAGYNQAFGYSNAS